MNSTLKELDQRSDQHAIVTWLWDVQLDIHEIKVDCTDGRLFTLLADTGPAARDMYMHPFAYEGRLVQEVA